ncbi:SusC/RagA family TonB-linked outer membrane protein [Geofilum rhodophaeum]|uniref:SusC/RagA family TonB-linked outer membrane protein n=1 Tax=Geofilum rhodophaeum TaxID=1965019 RepID=UPI000B5289B4|nr:TonB-dependent receptor [Geofilum rhodophaeum]
MKYIFLTLLGLLVLAPATYAEASDRAEQLQLAQSDEITVQGMVIDDFGAPLPGATIQQVGTTQGSISDIDGKFTLSVPADAVLVVSFVGSKSVEINVDGRTDLGVITLVSDLMELDQVVVIGYGTQRKVDLTGSVAVVNTEEMKKVSHSNISTMLEGKVAGVQITSDGQPGADPAVRIRGIGTFRDSNPLYVIDGVPMGTTIRDFSPNDIESLQVLKDASAAAIYGSRAANGVVIITTKQGSKNQKMKIDYSGYYGLDEVRKGVYDVMDSKQYGDYLRMAYANSEMDVPAGYNPNSQKYVDPTVVNTDWFEEAFKIGVRQNHNVSLSGGGENNTYNIGLDYYNQEGTMEGAGPNFERYTARINNTMEVKFIKLQTSIVYSHSNQDNMALSNANEYVQGLYGQQFPVMASALLLPPTIKAYDESTWVLDDKISSASQYNYDSYGYGTYYDDVHGDLRVTNVLLTNNLLKRNSVVDRIVGTGTATVDFNKMLGLGSDNHTFNYKLNLSYNKTTVKGFTFVPSFIQSTTNYLAKSGEILTQEYRTYGDLLVENLFNYAGEFGRNKFDVVLGQTFERNMHHRLTGNGINLNEPYFLQLQNAAETNSETYEEESVLASYIGRLNYNYDDKYLVSATVRYDGSSRLSADDRWEWFRSVSGGWRLEKENFFTVDPSIVNLLKLRGSYGELGNQAIGPNEYMAVMARNDYTYSFGNTKVTGSSISNYVNEYIRWERKKTLDFGLDLGMFNNQLEFNFDWYRSTSEDLLYGVAVPANAGATNAEVTMNAATLENSGLEFLLTYRNRNNAVKYDITANFSTLNNEVKKLGVLNTPVTQAYTRTEVGREVGAFYGYVYEGIFQTQTEIDSRVNAEGVYINQPGAQPGDVAYADVNNDGEITNEDQTYLGSGIPDYHFGLNAGIEWNNFDLSIASYGAAGFQVVDFVDVMLTNSYGTLNKSVDLLNAWTPDNTNTDVPRVAYKSPGSINNDMFSERFLQDAAYLKIANVTLGYNFPDRWFSGVVTNVRAYVTGQNLATITKYKGYNVDFAGGTFSPGYNYSSYPTPRTVLFGMNFSF